MGEHLRYQPKPEDGTLPMWVIYERPRDYPNGYVVRRHVVVPGSGIWVDPIAVGVSSLELARREIPQGLFRRGRQDGDDPAIKEVWI